MKADKDAANDKLSKIFELQEKLNAYIIKKRGLNFTAEEWMQKQTLALIAELTEFLDEINYKWWKNPKAIEPEKVKEELADVFHFFVSLCLSAGMTGGELYDIYVRKNKENTARQDGLSQKKGYN